jgi:hypothetical protein
MAHGWARLTRPARPLSAGGGHGGGSRRGARIVELRPSPGWKLLTRGALLGWLAGVLWSAGLAILSGAGHGGAILPLAGVPLLAVPWACVGVIVGARGVGGAWPVSAHGGRPGAIRGGFSVLATIPPHAWGVSTLYCLGWALACTAAGTAYGLGCRLVLAPTLPACR